MCDEWLRKIKSDFVSLIDKTVFSDLGKQKTEINFIDVIDKARSELVHSNILAWLLNPKGSHCLGTEFIKSFIAELGLSKYVDSFDDLEIIREKGLDDKFIDILFFSKNNKFLVGIENKIDSIEHSNQLTNYFTTLERDFSYFTNRFYIYLTPIGNNPSDKEWTPCSYYLILNLLEDITLNKSGKLPKRVKSFLEGYIEILRRKIVLKDENIDDNWNDIFKIFFGEEAEKIREYRNNLVGILVESLETLLPKYEEENQTVKPKRAITGEGYRILFTTKKLDLYPNVGKSEYKGRLLHFEIWVLATMKEHRKQRNKVLVVLVVNPAKKGSEAIKDKILEKAYLNLDLFSHIDKGHGIYSKFLWDLKDFSGIEQMKVEVEKTFLDFLNGDLKEIEKNLSLD